MWVENTMSKLIYVSFFFPAWMNGPDIQSMLIALDDIAIANYSAFSICGAGAAISRTEVPENRILRVQCLSVGISKGVSEPEPQRVL